MHLNIDCAEHGVYTEKVESDASFFKRGYELEYAKPYKHLVLPITYRCNLNCKYCYTLSNSSLPLPSDRRAEELVEIINNFDGNITLIGGEPTVREDLLEIIGTVKEKNRDKKISLATNGQKFKDIEYVINLKKSGLDFVFLSLNDVDYEGSKVIYENKRAALDNCNSVNIPVWLQQTVEDLDQLSQLSYFLEEYRKLIFNVTIRSVKPFGYRHPDSQIFVSDIIKYFDKVNDYKKGLAPFNRFIRIKGKDVKVCSWVNDMKRLDPIDSNYFISNDLMTTYHRGMKIDEVLLKDGNRLSALVKS